MMRRANSVRRRSRKSADPLLDQSGFAVDRLPMLALVFERLAASIRRRAAHRSAARAGRCLVGRGDRHGRASSTCSRRQRGLRSARRPSFAPSSNARVPGRPSIAALTFAFVQVLLGGDGARSTRAADRPFTKIEMNLAQISELDARKASGRARSRASPGHLRRRAQRDARRHRDARPARHRRSSRRDSFRAPASNGALTLVIPQAALLPIRAEACARRPGARPPSRPIRAGRGRCRTASARRAIPVEGRARGDSDDPRRGRRACKSAMSSTLQGIGHGPRPARMRRP